MCRRTLLVALAAALLMSAPGEAQQLLSDTERARIEARLAELDARWEKLRLVEERRAAETEARVREAQQRQVTDEIGPVVVAGEAALVSIAMPHVEEGLDDFRESMGDLSFLPTLRIEVYRPDELGFVNANRGAPTGLRRVAIENPRGGSDIRGIVREHVLAQLPDPIEQWAQGWGWDSRFEPRIGFQALLESTHPDAVRCLQGDDLDACASFLFLEYDGSAASSAEALARWYPLDIDSRNRGEFFENIEGGLETCRIAEQQRQPEASRADQHAVCLREAAENGVFNFVPSEGPARGSLLAFALSRAEPGNLERTHALPAGATVGDQLSSIAGIPAERLMAEWREGISLDGGIFDTGRPGSGRGPLTLLWAGGFALIALRSTRWRLG